MELPNYKCTHEGHQNLDVIKYCQKCNLYLCNECEKYHLELFKDHHVFPFDKDNDEILAEYCKEINHQNELNYFCKDHNVLCCANCIAKIKTRENGKHHDCNVCDINDICDEKKKNLSNNIKTLENLSNVFQSLLNDLKKNMKEVDKNKKEINQEIQKIFTKIEKN